MTEWRALVVLAVIVLLPVGRGSELPMIIGAIGAVALLWARREELIGPQGVRVAITLFACYWIPALLSGPFAVAPAKTWSTVAVAVRFLLFALFAVHALRNASLWRVLRAAVGIVVLLWLVDAWIQMISGHSLGGAAQAERLSGIFGADNLKLGPVLATLSPFLLLAARGQFGRRGLALAFLLLLVPILLAGSRAAWLSFAVVTVLIAWRETRRWPQFLAVSALAVGCGVAVAGIVWVDSQRFDARMDRSLLALGGTLESVNEASAGRLSIWRDALRMSRAHPLTGVGVRGFRYAYPEYAAPGDPFVGRAGDVGASHAHQIVLEVLSETGAIGLLFWLVGVACAIRAWRRAEPPARERALAPALALIAMCFPVNSHFAFYSAWWGLLFWWLVALYCAALGAKERRTSGGAGATSSKGATATIR
ncbi:MAG TPA: O-antigen ligase family protein [Rhodanobacteraceae bacterium]|nr:O-antigen ligase family protein [Rhodanobacteraceae bacterium]